MYAQTGNPNTLGVVENPFEVKKQPTQCRDPIFAVLFYANIAVIVGVAIAFGQNPFTQANATTVEEAAGNFTQTNATTVEEAAGNFTQTNATTVEQVAGNFTQTNTTIAEETVGNDATIDLDYTPFFYVTAIAGGVGVVLSCIALQVLMCIPESLIKVALIGQIALCGAVAAASFSLNQAAMGIVALIIMALTGCYTYCIWSRIPFATANLKTGTASIRANSGVIFLAYIVVAVAFAWTFLWTVSVIGVQDQLISCERSVDGVTECTNPNYLYFFLLFVSYFFTHQVLQNTVHTTVAGVVGTWWFVPNESGFCGSAVCGSFFRSITTSFGSICFGSLIVAVIEATRQIVEMARQNDDLGQMLACCIDCLLSFIQDIVEYFNKWAYVYVGIYGFGYCEAGKNVMQLFRDRGWEAVIADDIVSTVLNLMALVVGIMTAAIAYLTSSKVDWFEDINKSFDGDTTFVSVFTGIIGFIIGFALCAIIMGVISSSVNATIVLFAEAPNEFETNHPELSREMRTAYGEAHPGCLD